MTAPRYHYTTQRVELIAPWYSPRSTSTVVNEQLNSHVAEHPFRRLVALIPEPASGQVVLAVWEERADE